MNEVKKQIEKVRNSITSLEFVVSCKATSNGFSSPVNLSVSGLDKDKKNQSIINQVKDVAAVGTISKMNPEKISKAVDKMDCPDECKAWIISVLWYSFCESKDKKQQAAWMKVYRFWEKKYSFEYNNHKLRDELLLALGLPPVWISKRTAKREDLHAKMVEVSQKN